MYSSLPTSERPPVWQAPAEPGSRFSGLVRSTDGLSEWARKHGWLEKRRLWIGASITAALLLLASQSWSRPLPSDRLPSELVPPATEEDFFASLTTPLPLPLDSPLDTRLAHWLAAPIADFARWRTYNDQACGGRTAANEIAGFVGDRLSDWTEITAAEVAGIRNNATSCLARSILEPRGTFSSKETQPRGIVYTAGGRPGSWQRTLVSLRLLRNRSKSTLPVEVFHYAVETVPASVEAELKVLKATPRAIRASVVKDASMEKNFQIKATAIIEASFREVLSLDSDNLPCGSTGDIDGLFAAPAYRRLGAMFWPDIWKTSPMNAIWRILGCQCRDEFEFETGQIVIDKSRHLDALLLTECMLDDGHVWSPRFSDGDKDLFRFAFLALRKRWAVPGRMVGIASTPPISGGPEWAGHTMIQHDSRGEEIFVHANMLKTLEVRSYKARIGTTWGPIRRMKPLGTDMLGGVEADHLADADFAGQALVTSTQVATRKRAALERGFQVAWGTAPIIRDFLLVRWEDIRASQGFDGPTGVVDWTTSPLEDVNFKDLDRLRDFEEAFFASGGKASYDAVR